MYSICYKTVRDYFEAEDLAQETFLSVYKHLSTFDRRYEKAWICRIATNKCLDYLKRSDRQVIPTEDTFFITQQGQAPSPEENALASESKKQLFDLCFALNPPYQEIALDYFFRELPAAEIATKTGKNLKTVQTQIYRAKAMLKKIYQRGPTN